MGMTGLQPRLSMDALLREPKSVQPRHEPLYHGKAKRCAHADITSLKGQAGTCQLPKVLPLARRCDRHRTGWEAAAHAANSTLTNQMLGPSGATAFRGIERRRIVQLLDTPAPRSLRRSSVGVVPLRRMMPALPVRDLGGTVSERPYWFGTLQSSIWTSGWPHPCV